MKQVNLLIMSCLCLSFGLNGQSLKILNFDHLVIGNAHSTNAMFAYASIQNTSNSTIKVSLKQSLVGMSSLTDSNAICWGSCYPPGVNQSAQPLSILPGEIDSLHFTGHVYPDKIGISDWGEIRYTFFDEEDPVDSISMMIRYEVQTGLAVMDYETNDFLIYPNPAQNELYIGDDPNGTLYFFNSAGVGILSKKFVKNPVEVNLLDPGIYTIKWISENGDYKLFNFIKVIE